MSTAGREARGTFIREMSSILQDTSSSVTRPSWETIRQAVLLWLSLYVSMCKGHHTACLASTTSSRFGPHLAQTRDLCLTRDLPSSSVLTGRTTSKAHQRGDARGTVYAVGVRFTHPPCATHACVWVHVSLCVRSMKHETLTNMMIRANEAMFEAITRLCMNRAGDPRQ